MATLRATSFAFFLTSLSSRRRRSLWLIFSWSFCAAAVFLCKKSTTALRVSETIHDAHFGIAEFVFCLRLKNGFFELHRNRAIDGFPHIQAAVTLLVKLIDAFQNALSKSTLMRAPVDGVLPVDKRKIVLPVIGRMGKCKFEILPLVIRGFVKRGIIDLAVEKIEQAAPGDEFLFVKKRA